MYASFFKISFIFIITLVILQGCSNSAEDQTQAKDGVLDLSAWNFQSDGTVRLNGEWEFYWKEIYSPNDFADKEAPLPTGYMNVPTTWNGFTLPNGEELTGRGYATYRLVVLLNEKKNDNLYGIRMPAIYSNYHLWINGELIGTNGKVAKTREDSIAKRQNETYIFSSDNRSSLEVIVQVSNFNHAKGGFFSSVELGGHTEITKITEKKIASELALAGILFIMGVYHLALFILRRNERSTMFFGLVCLLYAIRALLTGEIFYTNFLDLPYEVDKKLEYLTFYISVPLFVLYVYSLYKVYMNRLLVQISTAIGLVFSLLVLAAPALFYTQVNSVYQIYTLVFAVYLTYVFYLASKHKQTGAIFSLIMFCIYAGTVVNDILFYNQIIDTGEFASKGLFLFLFAQALIISLNFSKAFNTVEDLSESQKMWHQVLEQIVEDRTKELQDAMEDLKSAQKQLVEAEKMSALGNLVAGVAHEVNTPIGIGITAISYLENKNNEFMKLYNSKTMRRIDLEKYLQAVNEATNIIQPNLIRASELVKSFKLVATDQSTDTKRLFKMKEYIDNVITSLKPEIKKNKVEVNVSCDQGLELVSYPGDFSQVITNLIMNSILHAFNKSDDRRIFIEVVDKQTYIEFLYKDNGKGMSEEVLKHMFEPFFTTKRGAGGTGLGMHIVFNIVTQKLKGTIDCESQLEKGTTFYMTFPTK